MKKVRIDKYLWAVRLFKTRALATIACGRGKVKIGGLPVKASKNVTAGDEYEVNAEARKWVIKVVALLDKRVAHTEAIKHYNDITPPEELEKLQFQASSFYTGKRESKVGRPTKKQRRDLQDFTGSEEP